MLFNECCAESSCSSYTTCITISHSFPWEYDKGWPGDRNMKDWRSTDVFQIYYARAWSVGLIPIPVVVPIEIKVVLLAFSGGVLDTSSERYRHRCHWWIHINFSRTVLPRRFHKLLTISCSAASNVSWLSISDYSELSNSSGLSSKRSAAWRSVRGYLELRTLLGPSAGSG